MIRLIKIVDKIVSYVFCNRCRVPNYDDYVFDLKQKIQESHKIAKERLVQRKIKSKNHYDKKVHSEDYEIKDMIT